MVPVARVLHVVQHAMGTPLALRVGSAVRGGVAGDADGDGCFRRCHGLMVT